MMRDLSKVFDSIYSRRKWGSNVSLSGEGSMPVAAFRFMDFLQHELDANPKIKTILDLGCGDWKVWRSDFFVNHNYIGIDASQIAISLALSIAPKANTIFMHLDFLGADLPEADLVIIKDVVIHLSNFDFDRLLKSLSKYERIIITSDLKTSGFRVLLGNIRRAFTARRNEGISIPKMFKHIIGVNLEYGNIETGNYRWFNLATKQELLRRHGLHITQEERYRISGLTRGRSTTKAIYVLQRW